MKKRWLDRLFGGVVLIGIGMIFLLNQLEVIDVSLGYVIGHYWPVILIILGIKELLKGRKSFVGAAVLLLIGTYFLGRNEGWDWLTPGSFFKIIIPAILIMAGLYVIFKPHDHTPPPRPNRDHEPPVFTPAPPEPEDLTAKSTLDQQFEEKFGIPYTERKEAERKGFHMEVDEDDEDMEFDDTDDDEVKDRYKQYKKKYKQQKKHHQHMKHQMRHDRRHGSPEWEEHGETHYDGGKINRSAFIGDIHLGRDYFELKPTNLSQFIGDTVLDLTNAHIPYGETKINISAFIGDIKVYVPEDTDLGISVNSSSFIGDMFVLNESRSGFMSSCQMKTPYYKDARKKIRINVSAFIGDIKVNKVG